MTSANLAVQLAPTRQQLVVQGLADQRVGV